MAQAGRQVGLCGRVALIALSLLVLPASLRTAGTAARAATGSAPPAGQHAGSGSLEGTERVDDWNFDGQGICIKTNKSIYALAGVGTYQGRTASGQDVIYKAQLDGSGTQTLYGNGPIKVEVESQQPYYYGPFGTHGTTDASCTPATAGTPINADFRIFAADHVYELDGSGAQVPCKGTGTFQRGVANQTTDPQYTHKWYAEWTLSEDCTVVGNAAGTPGTGVAPAHTAHTDSGVHEPCFSGSCVNNIRVDYQQYLPFKGLHVSMSGPANSTIGTTVAVSAAVTNDGVAVANATVSFSVAGPAPSQPPGGAAVTGSDGRAALTFTAAVAGDYTVTATATNAGVVAPTTTVPATTIPATTLPTTTLPTTTTLPPSTTTLPAPTTTLPATTTASGSMVVHFDPLAPPAMTVDGPPRWQTEDNETVTATFTDAGNPIPGVSVSFAVTGPGQATPPSGSAMTDNNGQAPFTFAANRAGDYTVSASGSLGGQNASATHVVHVDIKSFSLAGSLDYPPSAIGAATVGPVLMRPEGDYAYVATNTALQKIDLRTFQQVGTLAYDSTFTGPGSGVVDPAGRYAYFGTGASPGRVVKVDLNTFQEVAAITMGPGEDNLQTAVIDPAGAYAYFGTAPFGVHSGDPGRVVKIDLASFGRVGAITFQIDELPALSALMDPGGRYAYFGAQGQGATPGRVVKVDLATFSRVDAITLNGQDERFLTSAVIDPKGAYAYFGTNYRPGADEVVKVDLNSFQRVGALILAPGEVRLYSAVIDPAGRSAYFGVSPDQGYAGGVTGPWPSVVKIDLGTFERDYAVTMPAGDMGQLASAVIDPAGNFAYFGKNEVAATSPPPGSPSKLYKVEVSRPPAAWLVAGNDAYTTPYLTPLSVAAPGVLANDSDTADPDPLSATLVAAPAHGNVSLKPDGSFTYTPADGFSGIDTFTYQADDGMDYSAPATVSVTVPAPPQGVQAVNGSAFGFYTNVGLFGGPQSVHGGPGSSCEQAGQPACNPGQSVAVATPPAGGDVSATDPDGNVGSYGPAYIFENHGALTVHASGSTGPTGSVSASASVADISDNDPFHAGGPDGAVSSTCTANLSGVSGSTQIVNGRLVTSLDAATANPDTEIDFAHTWNPDPNTVYSGSLNNVGDTWRIVFNEQILGPDSITVNAVHLYLLGPTAIGDMIIGQSKCALTQAAPATAPAAAADSYTATAGQTLSVAAPGVLANDTDSDGGPLSAATLAPIPPPSTGGGAWTFPSDPAHGTVSLGADGSFTYTANQGYTGADSFTYQAQDARGATSAPTTVNLTVNAGVSHAVADFAGDGVTDLSVFRPSGGQWLIADGTTTFLGLSGDLAVPCDYGGGGINQAAVYRATTGGWYIAGQDPQFFGLPGDIPVPGHYGGDTNCDLAVFRPATGAWYIQNQPTQYLGLSGDIPVPAAYRGGNLTLPAVYRPSTGAWYIAGPAAGSVELAYYGLSGDIPVPADYTATGTATIAVWRPSAGAWYIQNQTTQYLGLQGDIPVPGNYTAGGGAAIAVFRPASGGWYINGQATQYYGLNGDQPLPLPAAVTQTFFP